MRIARLYLFFLCGLFCRLSPPAAAQELPSSLSPLTLPSARYMALGGYHAAFAPGFEAFFANPACLYGLEAQKSVTELSFALVDFAILDLLFADGNPNDKFANLVMEGIEISLDLGGPLAAGALKNNGGWGVFNATRLHIRWELETVFKPGLKVSEELFFIGGKSFRFLDNGSVTGDAGFLLKPFFRGSFVPDLYLQEIKHLAETLSNDYFEGQLGLGFDLGARVAFSPVFSAALVFHDPASPVFVTEYRNFKNFLRQEMVRGGFMWLPRRLAAGVCWNFPAPFWGPFVTDITIMADYNQVLPFLDEHPRYWMLEIGIGLEIRLLEVFFLRAGMSECLPAFGIGFDFMIFKMDAAFCIRELGQKPGDYPANAASISFLFRY